MRFSFYYVAYIVIQDELYCWSPNFIYQLNVNRVVFHRILEDIKTALGECLPLASRRRARGGGSHAAGLRPGRIPHNSLLIARY